MKNLLPTVVCTFAILLISRSTYAQTQLYVAPGTQLTIAANETLTVDSMWLTPSSDFIVDSNALSHNTTATNTGLNNYVSSVYKFISGSNPFSGSIGIRYTDAELNNIDESALRLYINNGTSWQEYSDNNTNDASANTVITTQLSNVLLNEITLGRLSSTLALQWGPVNAWRLGRTVRIQWDTYQEQNIDHYDVERSTDGTKWTIALQDIPAANLSASQVYNKTDYDYYPGKIFYRIRHTAFDRSLTYSKVVTVPAENSAGGLTVFPNPSAGRFAVSGIDPAAIKHLQVINAQGMVVKEWSKPLASYDITSLAAGTYTIQVALSAGTTINTFIIKLK